MLYLYLMPCPSHHPHIRFFRSSFAHRELMQEHVWNFLPKELVERLHLRGLSPLPCHVKQNRDHPFRQSLFFAYKNIRSLRY